MSLYVTGDEVIGVEPAEPGPTIAIEVDLFEKWQDCYLALFALYEQVRPSLPADILDQAEPLWAVLHEAVDETRRAMMLARFRAACRSSALT